MQFKFELLKKGDRVLNVWDSHIAIKRKSGDVEIFSFYLDNDNLPRLSENTILITEGGGSITTKSDNNDIEFTTF